MTTLKQLVEKYGEDYEIKLSVYSCGQTYQVNLEDLYTFIDTENKTVVFDCEYN